MRQLLEEGDDRRHLRNGHDAVVRVARVAEVVTDSPEQLVVIGRRAHAAAQVAEVLDQQVAGAVLADLEVVAARVNAAEDPRKPGDQKVVLGDVGPDLLAGQGAGGEALEVLRSPEGAPRQELARQRIEPLFGRHGGRSIARGAHGGSHPRARARMIRVMDTRIRVGTSEGLWEIDGDRVGAITALPASSHRGRRRRWPALGHRRRANAVEGIGAGLGGARPDRGTRRNVPGGDVRRAPGRHRAGAPPPADGQRARASRGVRRHRGAEHVVHAMGRPGRRSLDRERGRRDHPRERSRRRRRALARPRTVLGADPGHRERRAPGSGPSHARRRRAGRLGRRLRREQGRRRLLAARHGRPPRALPARRRRGGRHRARLGLDGTGRPPLGALPQAPRQRRGVRALPGRAPDLVRRRISTRPAWPPTARSSSSAPRTAGSFSRSMAESGGTCAPTGLPPVTSVTLA